MTVDTDIFVPIPAAEAVLVVTDDDGSAELVVYVPGNDWKRLVQRGLDLPRLELTEHRVHGVRTLGFTTDPADIEALDLDGEGAGR